MTKTPSICNGVKVSPTRGGSLKSKRASIRYAASLKSWPAATLQMLTLNYLARPPLRPPRARPPLLLLLHGVGGNEEGLFKYAARFDPRFVVLSVRAPYALGPDRYRWFDVEFTAQGPINHPQQAEQSRQLFVQFINDAVMAFGCAPRQVYLFGFSQGATLAYSVLFSAPQKLRGDRKSVV